MAEGSIEDSRYCGISKYSTCWSGSYVKSQKINLKDLKIKTAIAASVNYLWIAADLAGCDQLQANYEPADDLRLWLLYYYRAFVDLTQKTQAYLPDLPNNITSVAEADITLLQKNLLSMRDMLAFAGVDIANATIKDLGHDTMKVPRAQSLDLLAPCMLENAGPANITNLGAFKAVLSKTFIYSHQRTLSTGTEICLSGLPKIFFLCYTHTIATCSADYWVRDAIDPHRKTLRDAREERFRLKVANEVDEMKPLAAGSSITYLRLKAIKTWQLSKGTNLDAINLTPKIYNDVANWMYKSSEVELEAQAPGLEPTYGCDHLGEVGRAFSGCGRDMFEEMSRCWKCRFMYHYDIPRPGEANTTGLVAEEPT